jgi:hypothetical protein
MAQRIETPNLMTFAASLRQYTSAHVVLFMDTPVSSVHTEICIRFHIEIQRFDLTSLTPSFMASYHPSSSRWPLIYNYLVEQEKQQVVYDMILLIDVRDSAFQGDPFKIVNSPGLYVFHGVESKTIGECGWNGGWVKGEKCLLMRDCAY